LSDARQQVQVFPQGFFLALFYGFVFRLSSFQQLEPDLAEPSRQRWLGVQEAFGDDVLHYSLCGFHVPSLEGTRVEVNRRLKRNKVLDPGRLQGRWLAAPNGLEILSSHSRCCVFCRQRRVSGFTMASAERQPDQRRISQIQSSRTVELSGARPRCDLRSTLIWWRRARIANRKAARVRKESQRAVKTETNRLDNGMSAYQRSRADIN